MGTDVDRPIFIVAPHRSGTTLLYDVLGRHPEVGYFNLANRRFPSWPRLAHVLTRFGLSDRPREAQAIWDRFWQAEDDCLGAQDATPRAIAWHRWLTTTVLRLRSVPRFVAKYPRLSLRMGWLDAVFPGAIFVHIVRDWRAVVNSTLARRAHRDQRGGKWYGMRIPGWRGMRDAPPDVVAGRQYRVTTRAIEEQAPAFDGRFLSVRYGQLCARPIETLKKIVAHCGLAWTEGFEAQAPKSLVSANYKWRERLTAESIERIRAEDPDFYQAHEEVDT